MCWWWYLRRNLCAVRLSIPFFSIYLPLRSISLFYNYRFSEIFIRMPSKNTFLWYIWPECLLIHFAKFDVKIMNVLVEWKLLWASLIQLFALEPSSLSNSGKNVSIDFLSFSLPTIMMVFVTVDRNPWLRPSHKWCHCAQKIINLIPSVAARKVYQSLTFSQHSNEGRKSSEIVMTMLTKTKRIT